MEEELQQTMKSIIMQVIKINEKYEEIKKIKGENFNIFSILKLERNELQTHSNFIYELLKPNGSHNQGSLFLKLFLEKTLHLEEYGDIKYVHQEHSTIEDRRIDLVIETEINKIGIEMKIDAGDESNQLLDYKNELDRTKKVSKLYYLTLTGYEASDKSTNKNLQVDKDYFLLSFEDDIYNWIENCIEKSATIPLLREGLVHYRNLISKITNKISEPMEKEMEDLIIKPEQVEAVQILLNEYPKIWAKKEMEFWDSLEEKLLASSMNEFEIRDPFDIWSDDNGSEFTKEEIIENIANKRNQKNKNVGLALEKEYLEKKTSTNLDICEWNDKIYLYISFWNKDSVQVMPPKLKEICQKISFIGIDKKHRYRIINEKITFYGRYQENPTYDLFDKDKFNRYIEIVVNEVKNTINLIEKNEKSIIKSII